MSAATESHTTRREWLRRRQARLEHFVELHRGERDHAIEVAGNLGELERIALVLEACP